MFELPLKRQRTSLRLRTLQTEQVLCYRCVLMEAKQYVTTENDNNNKASLVDVTQYFPSVDRVHAGPPLRQAVTVTD